MAKVLAIIDAVKSLADIEARFGLLRSEEEAFFTEWQENLPQLTDSAQASLEVAAQVALPSGGWRFARRRGDIAGGVAIIGTGWIL